jgi:hypothetical protein
MDRRSRDDAAAITAQIDALRQPGALPGKTTRLSAAAQAEYAVRLSVSARSRQVLTIE